MTDFFAGLNDDTLATRKQPTEAQRAQIHIANGGDREATEKCPGCRGSGHFVSYSGRIVGNCFKCKGSGKVTKGQAGAHKAAQTKKHNAAEWLHAHHAEVAFMGHRALRSRFYADLNERFKASGKLSELQIEMIRKDMAEEPARLAAFQAKRDEAAPAVDLSKIEALFDTARSNGLKKLKFRCSEVDISPAPEHGANAGALYVTKNGEYFGKIRGGKFIATRAAPEGTTEALQALAADPLAVGIAYGKQTGNCCACGRELTDPISVERGIGPICADKWMGA